MKTKVLDTNIILEHSLKNIVEKFSMEDEVEIVIPFKVVMELDTFKKGNEIKNFNARQSLRMLEDLRKLSKKENKTIADGVSVTDRCSVRVFVAEEDLKIDPDKVDNDIILTTHMLDGEREDVELITLDIHERIIADCFGLESEEFESDIEVSELYTGIAEIPITGNQLQEFQSDYHNPRFKTSRQLYHNQFAIMTDPMGGVHYGKYDSKTQEIKGLKPTYEAWKIRPKKDKKGNIVMEQAMLMDLLLDPEITFVSVIGPSGTGKTLATLACALEQTMEQHIYNKIIVMRPLASIDKDIGALPGDKLEKLEPWMGSTFDSLEYLLEENSPKQLQDTMFARDRIYELIESGFIELEAMQFIRGRSIPNQFIIVDDAQNLSPHQATTIITRAGEGSKVVFLGDINKQQIDNPRLNSANNGLSYVVDKFKGVDPVIGHVTLKTVVRSKLASLGVELL